MPRSPSLTDFVWLQLHFQRPVAEAAVTQLLRLWASDPRQPRLVLEVRSCATTQFLLGVPRGARSSITATVRQALPGTFVTTDDVYRPAVTHAGSVRLSSRVRSLRTDDPEASTRAVLAALHRAASPEHLVVQIVLGPRKAPRAVSGQAPRGFAQLLGFAPASRPDAELRGAQRIKEGQAGFECTIRFGVKAASRPRRRSLISGLLAAARTLEGPGVRMGFVPERSRRLNRALSPWRWPVPLGGSELLALLAWPTGDGDFAGVPGVHPRLLPPSESLSATPDLVVAESTAPGPARVIGLDVEASLRHTWVLGPNGTGKSTLLATLIVQNIAAGRGTVVVEPKNDLVTDILARIERKDWDKVVVLDPTDDAVVGLNPLSGTDSPEARAEALLGVFRSLYHDGLGPRSQDILHSALLTLARRGDGSLAMVPLLLTNTGFRRSVVRRVAAADPVALGPFWSWYEALSDESRATVVSPLQNKLRPLLLNPGLRAVIGQRQPRITVDQILAEGKVLLVPLRKQVIGAEASRLLGSLVVAQVWAAVQRRAALPAADRPPVLITIDEVQDYLTLPTDLADALAQARGLGAGFVLAHQYAAQLTPALRAGFLGNIRSRVMFQLAHDDATLLAKGHPELTANDLTALPAYNVYAGLATKDGQVTSYASGRTSPLSPPISNPDAIRRLSRERHGRALDEIEQDLADLAQTVTESSDTAGQSGRKRRGL